MKKDIKGELMSEALQPFINHIRATPGTMGTVVRHLSEYLGQTQYRQNVEEYLHPDPAKRTEPRFGVALALLVVGSRFTGRNVVITQTGLEWRGEAPTPAPAKRRVKGKKKKAKRAKKALTRKRRKR